MTKADIAKNLLLDKNCDNCSYNLIGANALIKGCGWHGGDLDEHQTCDMWDSHDERDYWEKQNDKTRNS